MNDVIPVPMKRVTFQVHSLDFLIRHLASGWVFPTIQPTAHLKSFGRRRMSNQVDDGLVILKGLSAPIGRNEREQPVFHFVPFAGARGKVTDGNGKTGFIRELL